MAKINLKKFKKATNGTSGMITKIAKNLNVSRQAIYDYVKRSKKANQILEQEKELPFDMAESILYQKLNKKDLKAAEILLLKHKRGRARVPYSLQIGRAHV